MRKQKLSEVKPGCKYDWNRLMWQSFPTSHTAATLPFLSVLWGGRMTEEVESHHRGAWDPHALSTLPYQPKVEFARLLLGKITCPPHAHVLFLRHKQLRMFAHTQRMEVELSSTYWGWGININYWEFFYKEDWSPLPCLHFYWPSSRRHWNQSDRFHT